MTSPTPAVSPSDRPRRCSGLISPRSARIFCAAALSAVTWSRVAATSSDCFPAAVSSRHPANASSIIAVTDPACRRLFCMYHSAARETSASSPPRSHFDASRSPASRWRNTSRSSTASGNSWDKVASMPERALTAEYCSGSPTKTTRAPAAVAVSSTRIVSGLDTMPASSTTTTVSRFQSSFAAVCSGVRSSVPTKARAIVMDSSATFSPTITSAALPVGARPTTCLPA